MSDTPPVAYEQHAKIEVAKRELRTIGLVGTFVTIVLVTFILSCLSYCTQPASPKPLDREAQAARIIENNKIMACMRAGGSWMPIVVRYENGNSDMQMSCVTDRALPLAQAMNLKKGS